MTDKKKTTVTFKEETFEKIDNLIEQMPEVDHRNELLKKAVTHMDETINELSESMESIDHMMCSDSLFIIGRKGDRIYYAKNNDGKITIEEKTINF